MQTALEHSNDRRDDGLVVVAGNGSRTRTFEKRRVRARSGSTTGSRISKRRSVRPRPSPPSTQARLRSARDLGVVDDGGGNVKRVLVPMGAALGRRAGAAGAAAAPQRIRSPRTRSCRARRPAAPSLGDPSDRRPFRFFDMTAGLSASRCTSTRTPINGKKPSGSTMCLQFALLSRADHRTRLVPTGPVVGLGSGSIREVVVDLVSGLTVHLAVGPTRQAGHARLYVLEAPVNLGPSRPGVRTGRGPPGSRPVPRGMRREPLGYPCLLLGTNTIALAIAALPLASVAL